MNKKTILFSMGIITTTITPISTVLSCGSKTSQQKMNGITSDMVKTALNITPSATIPSAAATKLNAHKIRTATLNGLDNVTITVSHVAPNDNAGALAATAVISKKGLTPPKPFTITWNGFLTIDQDKMNGITANMVKKALGVTPSSTTLPSAATKPTTTTDVALNGLAGVTITISGVTPNDDKGTLIAKAAISKPGLTAPQGSPFTIVWGGYQTTTQHEDQKKMDGITANMVKSALNITPPSTTLPSAATKPTTTTDVTLNGLAGVTITISGVTPNDDKGTLTATAAISKTGQIPPKGSPFTIVWAGYQTQKDHDQILMNGITVDMVKTALNITPSSTTLPSATTKPTTTTDVTLNGLAGVTITISEVKADDYAGTLTATTTISKEGLTSPNPFPIEWTGFANFTLNWEREVPSIFKENYAANRTMMQKINDTTLLVGTNGNGFYKVDISKPTWVWTHIDDKPVAGFKTATFGSIIKVDDNDFIVATSDIGFYKLNTSSTTWTWTKISIFLDHDGIKSTMIKISNSKFLVTGDLEMYIIDVSTTTWTKVHVDLPSPYASGISSSFCMIDDNTLAVGLTGGGFYKVNISATQQSKWVWTLENKTLRTNDGSQSSILKVNDDTLLVGTQGSGFYWVDISMPTWVWRKVNNTNTGLTDASGQWSQISKINDNLLLVSTYDKGFFEVNIKTKGKEFWIPTTALNKPFLGPNSATTLSKPLQIGNKEWLVPTANHGFYKITY